MDGILSSPSSLANGGVGVGVGVGDSDSDSSSNGSTTSTGMLMVRFGSIVALLIGFQLAVARVGTTSNTTASNNGSSGSGSSITSTSSTALGEVKRRWQHAITGHVIVQASYLNLPMTWCLSGLSIAAAILLFVHQYYWDSIYYPIAGPFMRHDEIIKRQSKLPGAFYFLVGTIITTLLFPIDIARYAVECLSLADPIAAWIGQTIQSPKINIFASTFLTTPTTASVAGSIACFITSICIGWCMLSSNTHNNNDSTSIPMLLPIVVGAIACTISEAYPIINDNLSIPIITAFAVYTTIIQ